MMFHNVLQASLMVSSSRFLRFSWSSRVILIFEFLILCDSHAILLHLRRDVPVTFRPFSGGSGGSGGLARQPCNQKSCDDPVPCILSDWSGWEGSGISDRFRKVASQRSRDLTDGISEVQKDTLHIRSSAFEMSFRQR